MCIFWPRLRVFMGSLTEILLLNKFKSLFGWRNSEFISSSWWKWSWRDESDDEEEEENGRNEKCKWYFILILSFKITLWHVHWLKHVERKNEKNNYLYS